LGVLIFAAIVAGLVWLVAAYHRLVSEREQVLRAWDAIVTLLRQRHDELPRLLELCERQLPGESALIEEVRVARAGLMGIFTPADAVTLVAAERELRRRLAALLDRALADPALSQQRALTVLRDRFESLEREIDARTADYARAAAQHNAAAARFPRRAIARLAGYADFPTAEPPAVTAPRATPAD
jgi:LemA protein